MISFYYKPNNSQSGQRIVQKEQERIEFHAKSNELHLVHVGFLRVIFKLEHIYLLENEITHTTGI